MRNYLSILLLAAVGAATQTPKPAPKMVCWDGFSATTDTQKTCKGDWIEDQTGKSYPSGDGCNSSTCMDAACHFGVSTAMACAYHPIHIETTTLPPTTPPPVKQEKPQSADIFTCDVDRPCLATGTTSILSNTDTHGCALSFSWDDGTKSCTIRVIFTAPVKSPVTCSPVHRDQDTNGDQTMICWYTPKAVPTPK